MQTQHFMAVISSNEGPFNGDFDFEGTREMFNALGEGGWRLVGTTTLHNGKLLLAWENDRPDAPRPASTDEVHGIYL